MENTAGRGGRGLKIWRTARKGGIGGRKPISDGEEKEDTSRKGSSDEAGKRKEIDKGGREDKENKSEKNGPNRASAGGQKTTRGQGKS